MRWRAAAAELIDYYRAIGDRDPVQGILYELRFDEHAKPREDFVLNKAEFAGGRGKFTGSQYDRSGRFPLSERHRSMFIDGLDMLGATLLPSARSRRSPVAGMRRIPG